MRKFSFGVLLAMLVAFVSIGCKPADDTTDATNGTGTSDVAGDDASSGDADANTTEP